jgi:hypothetical protein
LVLNSPVALAPRRWPRLKISSISSGRPMSRLSAIRASKNTRARRGASNTRVREVSTWRRRRLRPHFTCRRVAAKRPDVLGLGDVAVGDGATRRPLEHRPIGRTGSHVVQHSDPLSDVLSGHAPIIVLRAPRRSVVTEQSAMPAAAAAAVEPWLSHLRWGELEGGRRLDGGCEVIAARRATAVGRSTGGCTADVLGGLP